MDKPIEITRASHDDTKLFLENVQACLVWHRNRIFDLEQAIIALVAPTIYIPTESEFSKDMRDKK